MRGRASRCFPAGLAAAATMAEEVTGRLRINSPRPTLPLLTNRPLPELCEIYPKVQLELIGEERLVDIVAEGFDAGISQKRLRSAGHDCQATDSIDSICRCRDAFILSAFRSPFASKRPGKVSLCAGAPLVNGDVRLGVHLWKRAHKNTGRVTLHIERRANRHSGCTSRRRPCAITRVARYEPSGAQRDEDAVLDEFAVEEPGLMVYYPKHNHALPKLRAFADFACSRLRKDFEPTDYLPLPYIGNAAEIGVK